MDLAALIISACAVVAAIIFMLIARHYYHKTEANRKTVERLVNARTKEAIQNRGRKEGS